MKPATLYRFPLTMALFLFIVSPAFAQEAIDGGLRLRGSASQAELLRRSEGYVEVRFELSLELTNTGSQPIILLRPEEQPLDELYEAVGGDLAETWDGENLSKFINENRRLGLPSCDFSPQYKRLVERLDQPDPPPSLTVVLQPFDTHTWQTSSWLYLTAKEWERARKIEAPLWLQLTYERWPSVLDCFDRKLGEKLQLRWKRAGHLWFSHNSSNLLVSEPIMLNLKGVPLNDPK